MSLVLTMTSMAVLVAQTPKDPAFDVAAVKPSADTQALSFSTVRNGGRYIGQNTSLRLLIKTAYGVHGIKLEPTRDRVDVPRHRSRRAPSDGLATCPRLSRHPYTLM